MIIDKDHVDSYQSEEAASILSTTLIYLLKLGNSGIAFGRRVQAKWGNAKTTARIKVMDLKGEHLL